LFGAAHTAYSFGPEPVSDAELANIYDAVKWAPTAMNSSPLRMAFVRSQDAKVDLEPLVAPGNVAKLRSAPVTAILAFDSDWHEHLPALQPFAEDPHLAWQDRDKRESMARFNASLQAGYFILGVRAHGLVAGPMGGFDKAGVDRTFFPDGRWRSLLLVNIGHPGPESFKPRMPRLDFDQAAVLL
jgi:3-hydroxypropanoate dehydrogenase